MQIITDDREKAILKSDTLKVFALLTALTGAYATYYPFVSHFIPPQIAVGIVAGMSFVGGVLRFRPQIQAGVDVLTGDRTLASVFDEVVAVGRATTTVTAVSAVTPADTPVAEVVPAVVAAAAATVLAPLPALVETVHQNIIDKIEHGAGAVLHAVEDITHLGGQKAT